MKNNNELIPTGGTTENFESVVKENKVKTTPIKKQTMGEKIIDKLTSILFNSNVSTYFHNIFNCR